MILIKTVIFILSVVLGGTIVFYSLRWFNGFVCDSKKGKGEKINRSEQKDDNKESILRFISLRNLQGERVANDDIEKLLGVSDSTATRYLQELKGEGKVRQVGKEGRGVHYEIS